MLEDILIPAPFADHEDIPAVAADQVLWNRTGTRTFICGRSGSRLFLALRRTPAPVINRRICHADLELSSRPVPVLTRKFSSYICRKLGANYRRSLRQTGKRRNHCLCSGKSPVAEPKTTGRPDILRTTSTRIRLLGSPLTTSSPNRTDDSQCYSTLHRASTS